MLKQYLEAGQIVNTHGVKGELVLEPWTDSAQFLRDLPRLWLDEGRTDAGVLASRVHKGRLLLTLQGVDTKEKADAWRGKVLYFSREDAALEEGTWFLADLIGLQAVDGRTGQRYGTVAEVLTGPANDVYRIVDDAGREYLFPAVRPMIRRIAPEEGLLELLPIPGIFDDAAEEVRP